ncbi:hypothetical protein KP509_20G032900 [Ceratopteris richardii]|uniref:BHLH domain-containing protein n=1 Tax=Ceratopteris richardii TaxID=49495 RepID=A0A8T2SHL0_CERRI|nr:hypothetical protein KP509_20G032900 [Ceratopteris richardii]
MHIRASQQERCRNDAAASRSSSCKSLASNPIRTEEIGSADGRPGSRDEDQPEPCTCDTFCHENFGQGHFTSNSSQSQGCSVTGESHTRSSAPMRKAEREKLRRDRLNEQLFELAGALDPDRPKNDKSTILADAIQTLKELMSDVEHLRAEHASLINESEDLLLEKKELHDERIQLTSMVESMKNQACQQMYAMILWRTPNPTSIMGGYAANTLSQGANNVDTQLDSRHPFNPSQMPIPFLPSQPLPQLTVPIAARPALESPYAYGGRGIPYYPYPFNFPDATRTDIPSSQAYGSLRSDTMPVTAENCNGFDADAMIGGRIPGPSEKHTHENTIDACTSENTVNASSQITVLQPQNSTHLSGSSHQQIQHTSANQDPSDSSFSYKGASVPQY